MGVQGPFPSCGGLVRGGHFCMCCCHSLLLMAAVLWNRPSSRNNPHYCCWITLQPECSLLRSSRNSCHLKCHSATLFGYPLVRVTMFTLSLKAAKVPYSSVTISSKLQLSMINVIIIYIQTNSVVLVQTPFKQMLNKKTFNLTFLMGKYELHYQICALWSIPPQTKP